MTPRSPTHHATAAVIRRLPGTAGALNEWASTLNARMSDARTAIASEGVACESWFSWREARTDLLFAFMLRGDAPPALPMRRASDIDAVHLAFKATWDRSPEARTRVHGGRRIELPASALPPNAALHLLRFERTSAQAMQALLTEPPLHHARFIETFGFNLGGCAWCALYGRSDEPCGETEATHLTQWAEARLSKTVSCRLTLQPVLDVIRTQPD